MPTKYLKHIASTYGIGIVLFILLLHTHTQPNTETIPKAPLAPEKQSVSRPIGNRYLPELERLRAFQKSEFYRTIIDNNLFRPLGWTPPKNEPEYNLVGTAVDSNGVISQATLLERRSNRYHFVTVGTELDGMIVKEIQAKKVIMDKVGETVTLNTGSLQLLATKRGNEGGGRGEGGSERAGNNNNRQNQTNQASAERRRQTERGGQDAAQQARRREMMERFRNASGEERRELIMQFRRRGGGDSGRRGRGRDR